MPVSTRSGRHATADLTPASRRQDHTTSPSASASFVGAPFDRSRETRPAITCMPDAAASTASRPHVRDDGQRPSDWDGMAAGIGLIWVKREMDSFCEQDWTGQIVLIRFDKLPDRRNRRSVGRSPFRPDPALSPNNELNCHRNSLGLRRDDDRSKNSSTRSHTAVAATQPCPNSPDV